MSIQYASKSFGIIGTQQQRLLVLVTQLAVASTTITIGCTLHGCYNILYH